MNKNVLHFFNAYFYTFMVHFYLDDFHVLTLPLRSSTSLGICSGIVLQVQYREFHDFKCHQCQIIPRAMVLSTHIPGEL